LASSSETSWPRCAPPLLTIAAALGLRIAARGHHRHRELQPERPALGELVQPRGGVAVDPRAEARLHELERLLEAEAQLRRPDDGAVAVRDQVLDVELAVGARPDQRAQVRRRVVQHVGERRARRREQMVGLVDDEHRVERHLRDLGEPGRDALERVSRRRLQQGVAERGTAGAAAHREHEPLDQPQRIVVRLRREPGDDRAPWRDARAAIARGARSCRSPRGPAPR
jgi:hypothetical protein